MKKTIATHKIFSVLYDIDAEFRNAEDFPEKAIIRSTLKLVIDEITKLMENEEERMVRLRRNIAREMEETK